MSNWIAIDEAAVRTGKLTVFIDAMQARASAAGEPDPLVEMIADVVATIRAALSSGNTLDQDTSKIPNSLKGLGLRLVNRRVKGYLDRELTTEESKQADDDRSYLNRIMDQKVRFEMPDAPAGAAEMQEGSEFEQTTGAATLGKPPQVATRETMDGL